MVDRHVGARLEAQPEQALRAIESRGDDAPQFEVRLDLVVVDGITLAADLLGPEAPVPGFDLSRRFTLCGPHFEQGLALALDSGQRPRPDLGQQALHRASAAGHGVGQRVVGVAGMALQACLLLAQAQDVAHGLAVVVLAGVFAATDPGSPDLLAQIAPLREGQKRNHQRSRQRDHRQGQPALGAGLVRRDAQRFGKAHEIGWAAQFELPGRFIVQHVLREARRHAGQLFHHLGIAGLLGRRQARAGTDKVQVQALEQALLLAAQAELAACGMEHIDALEEPRVHMHRAVMGGHGAGHHPLHSLQIGVRCRGGEVVENRRDPGQLSPGAVESRRSVLEIRPRGVVGDCRQLGPMGLHRRTQRGLEVPGQELLERRQAIGCGPRLKQRIDLGRHYRNRVHRDLVRHLPLRIAISSSSR